MEKILTPEAQKTRDDWNRIYDGGNCSCHISAPCGSCEHEGNPRNQKEDETCWENPPPQSVNDYKKVSTALTPLLEQIFHGENHTSKKIHEEIDTALEKVVAIINQARAEGVRDEAIRSNGRSKEARATALHDAMEYVKEHSQRGSYHGCYEISEEILSALTSLSKD